jgi:hypothetical protein
MGLIRFLKGRNELSHRAYILRMGLAWIYTLIWAALLVVTWLYWGSLAVYLKVVIILILIILTPTGSELVLSYRKYKERGW